MCSCALCTSVPQVPRAIRALVLDVPLALRAPGFQVPGAFTCSRVLRVLGTLVPHVSCALCFLVLFVPCAVRSFLVIVPHLLQLFQA